MPKLMFVAETLQLAATVAVQVVPLEDVVEPFAPRIVSFHFGLPAPALVARVKRWGAKVLSSA